MRLDDRAGGVLRALQYVMRGPFGALKRSYGVFPANAKTVASSHCLEVA